MKEKITILGCGRWASFHAWFQTEKLHNKVLMWGRAGDPVYERIVSAKKNIYIELPESVEYSCELGTALNFSNIIIISVLAQAMRDLSENIAKYKPKNKIFVLCMKGIDCETGERLSEILQKSVDETNKICVWVGPGHVQELTKGQPGIMIIDGEDRETVSKIVKKFKSDLIRLYEGEDLIGTEIGAAAKNVLGIAAGFLDGAKINGLKGALMARGIYEISRLCEAMGGGRMTPFGISHLGDFEATLFSENSHNRRYGEKYLWYFIKNMEFPNLDDFNEEIGTAEGVATCKALYMLAKKYKVEMPIINSVFNILYKHADPAKELKKLLSRRAAKEFRYE